jgi:hypothetical protein
VWPVWREFQYASAPSLLRPRGTITITKNSVTDPDPGSDAFFTTGSGMNIPDHFSESLATVFRVKNT